MNRPIGVRRSLTRSSRASASRRTRAAASSSPGPTVMCRPSKDRVQVRAVHLEAPAAAAPARGRPGATRSNRSAISAGSWSSKNVGGVDRHHIVGRPGPHIDRHHGHPPIGHVHRHRIDRVGGPGPAGHRHGLGSCHRQSTAHGPVSSVGRHQDQRGHDAVQPPVVGGHHHHGDRSSTGWARTSQRHRLVLATTTTTPTSRAQPTCSEGMADSWSEAPRPRAVYTDWP